MARLPPGLSPTHPAVIAGSWFGVGFIPFASGTWGSLAALPLGWIAYLLGGPLLVATAAVIAFAIGCWAASAITARGGDPDPSLIVIDEVAGQLLAVVAIPADPLLYALAFIGFRAADIFKPWPAGWADREIKSGFGVMLDDIFAALYVVAGLAILRWYMAS